MDSETQKAIITWSIFIGLLFIGYIIRARLLARHETEFRLSLLENRFEVLAHNAVVLLYNGALSKDDHRLHIMYQVATSIGVILRHTRRHSLKEPPLDLLKALTDFMPARADEILELEKEDRRISFSAKIQWGDFLSALCDFSMLFSSKARWSSYMRVLIPKISTYIQNRFTESDRIFSDIIIWTDVIRGGFFQRVFDFMGLGHKEKSNND